MKFNREVVVGDGCGSDSADKLALPPEFEPNRKLPAPPMTM